LHFVIVNMPIDKSFLDLGISYVQGANCVETVASYLSTVDFDWCIIYGKDKKLYNLISDNVVVYNGEVYTDNSKVPLREVICTDADIKITEGCLKANTNTIFDVKGFIK